MSNSNKKKSPVEDKISTSKSENDLFDMFEFYARIVKLIILRKDDADVVSKCSTWLAALRKHADGRVRCDYARLLLTALDRGGKPAWPFDDYPPAAIDPLDGDWTTNARGMFGGGGRVTGRRPPQPAPQVVTAVSEDKRQFAAYQTVPGAGMQCYYARSDRPLHEWTFASGRPFGARPDDDGPAAVLAVPLDWERSLAGLRRTRDRQRAAVTSTGKTSGSTHQISSKLSLNRELKFGSNVDQCRILDTFQEILNLGEAKFKWYDNSLLTGDIIPGSDLCIDWSIHEHEKTQLELDEEMVRSFDKLYPDNFRWVIKPELLDGIVKRTESSDRNARIIADECEKILRETRKTRQCAGRDPLPQCLASSEKIEKPSADENPTPTPESVWYRGPSTEVSGQSYVLDTKPSGEKLKDDCLALQPIIERSEHDDANECLVGLPSFTKVGESFNSIVNDAENIIRSVNDWLDTKELV